MYSRELKEDELMHHGVKDMHWGIRRYQNPDGSLTPLGRKRLGYSIKVNRKTGAVEKMSRGERKIAAKKRSIAKLKQEAKIKELKEAEKALKKKAHPSRKDRKKADELKKKRVEALARARDNKRLASEDKLSSKKMTDAQLDERIARLTKEQKYQELLQSTRASKRAQNYILGKLKEGGDNLITTIIKTGSTAVGNAAIKAALDKKMTDNPKELDEIFKGYLKKNLGGTGEGKDDKTPAAQLIEAVTGNKEKKKKK